MSPLTSLMPTVSLELSAEATPTRMHVPVPERQVKVNSTSPCVMAGQYALSAWSRELHCRLCLITEATPPETYGSLDFHRCSNPCVVFSGDTFSTSHTSGLSEIHWALVVRSCSTRLRALSHSIGDPPRHSSRPCLSLRAVARNLASRRFEQFRPLMSPLPLPRSKYMYLVSAERQHRIAASQGAGGGASWPLRARARALC